MKYIEEELLKAGGEKTYWSFGSPGGRAIDAYLVSSLEDVQACSMLLYSLMQNCDLADGTLFIRVNPRPKLTVPRIVGSSTNPLKRDLWYLCDASFEIQHSIVRRFVSEETQSEKEVKHGQLAIFAALQDCNCAFKVEKVFAGAVVIQLVDTPDPKIQSEIFKHVWAFQKAFNRLEIGEKAVKEQIRHGSIVL